MKKLLKILGITVGILILVALIVPLVVDVDQYRPKLVQVANEKFNGKLELGKLKLSLWGQILIQADGIRLTDSQGAEVLSVKDTSFHVSLLSLLTGSPKITVKMSAPKITVIKTAGKAGKTELNVLKLQKSDPESQSTVSEKSSKPSSGEIPGIVARARLGLDLKDADILYWDRTTGLKNEIRGLRVVAQDLSLSRATEVEISGDIDTTLGKTLSVKGPFLINAKLNPEFSDGKLQKGEAEIKGDFDKLTIVAGEGFSKKKGIPAHFEAKLKASSEEARFEKLEIAFHNLVIRGTGGVGAIQSESISLNVELKSNDIDLAAWTELVPSLKDASLSGIAQFSAKVFGTSEKPQYEASLELKNASAKAPMLKAKPVVQVLVHVVTDAVDKIQMDLQAPGSDLKVRGSVRSFSKPDIKLAITSSGIDFDQWIDFSKTSSGSGKKSAETADGSDSGGKGADAPGSLDTDAIFDSMRTSPALSQAKVEVTAGIPKLKFMDVLVTQMDAHFGFQNLSGKLDRFSLNVFEGSVKAQMGFDLKPKRPTYQLSGAIQGLNLKKAVESQLAMLKDTLYGDLSADFSGSGSSFNTDLATKNFNLKGKFSVKDAKFTSVDVGKMAINGINGALERVAEKVPQLRGKKLAPVNAFESNYQIVSSDFTMSQGVFVAPNFAAKVRPNNGVDLEGRTEVNLITEDLNAKWRIVDTYNQLKAADLSIETAGVQVDRVLTSGNPPVVSFPVTVGCKMKSPCYNYGEVPEALAKVALENASRVAQDKLKAEAKKNLQKAIPQNAPPAVQDALKRWGF